jgi:hypothetical protein
MVVLSGFSITFVRSVFTCRALRIKIRREKAYNIKELHIQHDSSGILSHCITYCARNKVDTDSQVFIYIHTYTVHL